MAAKKIDVVKKAKEARAAALALAPVKGTMRNRALKAMAAALRKNQKAICTANAKDIAAGKKKGLTEAMLDRLFLDPARIEKVAKAVDQIVKLPDPVGRVDMKTRRPEGFVLEKVRVPIGVVAIIYESRPNVTVDAAALCLKSGNAVILKGGSESIHSNTAIVKVIRKAVADAGLPAGVIQFLDTTDRAAVSKMLTLDELIDVVIPRGGETLIRAVAEQARMPVIKHYKGVCHVYIDNQADLKMAAEIAVNAKVQRPGVCNAMETLILHNKLSDRFVVGLLERLALEGVELRGDAATVKVYPGAKTARNSDWDAEYLDLTLAVRMVGSLEEAVDHINTYGSRHTDAIVTKSVKKAEQFVAMVDSSSVMVNASTRLSDGGVYGLGAEVGISTDKIGARGPMGIDDLTTYKWVVTGKGTIRK